MTQSSPAPDSEASALPFDDDDLAALEEAISQVLASEADSLTLHQHIDGKVRLDRTLWENSVELGWPGIGLPEAYGGLGFGPRGLDLLHRQLGRHAAPGPFIATLSAAQAISDAADDALKSDWLPRLAAGQCRLAVAALIDTVPGASEAWALGDEDSEAALVPVAGGDWGLVPLKSAECVDMWDQTRTMLKLDLGKSKPIATLPGKATSQSLAMHLSLAIASDGIGGARAILEQTIAYMKERHQFDRPIASFQALKHRVADLMTMIVAGEEFIAFAVDTAARIDEDAGIWAALAKVRAIDTYLEVSRESVQLHGGVGFTWEFDVHLFLKRAMLSEMLVAPHTVLRDRAHEGFAEVLSADRQPLELA